MPSDTKKQIILKIRQQINKLSSIFIENGKKMDAFYDKMYKTHVTNRASYIKKMKMTKAYVHQLAIQNHLNSKISHAEIELRKASLSNRLLEPYVLNATQLKRFIDWFEDWISGNKIPFMPHIINSINRTIRKWYILDIKLKYIEYVQIPNSENKAITNTYKLRARQINKKIEYLKIKNKDIRSVFWNKYFAKLIRKLEKSKKTSIVNEVRGVIDLQNVSKYYANKAIATKILKDVNLCLASGEFVVILGPSGSGKTTLLNIISGMDKATYGKVLIAGENLINLNNAKLTDFRRRNIGYVFQQYALLPNLTVKENVEIGQHLQKDKARRIDIDKLLHSLEMHEYKNKYPHELSGGQQQRVSIARSMAKNPNILFGDEPTGAVDEATSKNILDMFIRLNKEYGTTVVIVTHNKELTKLATTVVHVKDGYVSQQKR